MCTTMVSSTVWRRWRSLLCLLLLAACSAAPAAAGKGKGKSKKYFEFGTEVVKMKSPKDFRQLEKSDYLWIVAFYRESCGFCALLRPEWEAAATDLKRYVKVAAVDVEGTQAERDLAGSISQRYSFKIDGVPTIVLFKPTRKSGQKPLADVYKGERKAKAVSEYTRSMMPSFVTSLTSKSFDPERMPAGPYILFFTKQTSTSPLLKALASSFRDRLPVAEVRVSGSGAASFGKKLADHCGVTELPGAAAVLVPEGGASLEAMAESVQLLDVYTRKLSIMSLENWMIDYVPKSAGGRGKGQGKGAHKTPQKGGGDKPPTASNEGFDDVLKGKKKGGQKPRSKAAPKEKKSGGEKNTGKAEGPSKAGTKKPKKTKKPREQAQGADFDRDL